MLPNLYALRFILALFVIIYHLPNFSEALGYPFYKDLPLFSKGTVAVYYFFSLSGFLIIRLVYIELIKTKTFNFKAFYFRRIQRLFPVYYLVLFIGIVLFRIILPQFGIYRNLDYNLVEFLMSYIFFIPNVFIYYHNPGIILTVLWSIGVEEQFYLFAPLILYLGRKRPVYTISIALFVTIILLFIYSEFYNYKNYYFYFLFGGVCSVISERKKFSLLKNKIVHIIIYAAFFVSFFLNTKAIIESDVLYHLFNMLISGLLITLISFYPLFNLNNSLLNYFGKISYGIYMYHMVVTTGLFFLLDRLILKENLNSTLFIVGLNFTVVGLTLIVSHLSYCYFEKIFYQPKTPNLIEHKRIQY